MPIAVTTLWRLAPYIGGALLAVAAYAWAYDNGRDTEREKWQRQAAIEAQKVRERENALQAQIDAAGAALSERAQNVERIRERTIVTRNYYASNPTHNVACLGPDRLRHVAEADAAALDAAGSTR